MQYDLSMYFYLFVLLDKNLLIFGRFFYKDITHLSHLFCFSIIVDYNAVKKQNKNKTQQTEIETILTHYCNNNVKP